MKSISIFIFFKNISLVRRSFKRHILKSILTVFFSAGWHLMPNMIKVQNISRNQLAGKQWCCPKNVPSVIRRQDSGYWDCRCSQHHRLKLKREGHCNTFGSSFKVTKKKKDTWEHSWGLLRQVSVQVERVGTEFHSQQDQVSWRWQPHAVESSSVTLGFGEFEDSLKNSSSFNMLC